LYEETVVAYTMTIPLTVMGVAEPAGNGALQTPWGPVTVALLVEFAVLATFWIIGAVAAFSYLAAARDAVDSERDRVAAELAAFERFGERVRAFSPRNTTSAEAFADGPVVARSSTDPPDGRADVERIRQMYRETAMAVDHFEDDYDETLGEHARAELGPDAGGALAEGRDLTPGLRTVLAKRAEAAAAQRRDLLDRLDEEEQTLDEDERTFVAALAESRELVDGVGSDAGFGDLEARWRRLETLEEHVSERTATRSRRLAETNAVIPTYLYDSFPVPDPVLADAAAAVGVIRERRERVTDALTRAN
jgi:hypothetical protein